MLERRGLRGSWFVSAGLFGAHDHLGDYVTAPDVADLARRGHEVACHTFSHLDCARVPAAAVVEDVELSRTRLAELGCPPETFAYPFGEVAFAAKAALAGRFTLRRAIHPGLVRRGADLAQAPVLSDATVAKLEKLDAKLGLTPCLILTVSENGFGKRTDCDAYRLQSRGGKGVINMKTTPKIGKVASISLVDETTEMMLISQFGKIIRIDTKQIRSAGRSTQGVKLLDLEKDDKVAAAMTIPPEDPKSQPEDGTLLQ